MTNGRAIIAASGETALRAPWSTCAETGQGEHARCRGAQLASPLGLVATALIHIVVDVAPIRNRSHARLENPV